MAEKHPPRPPFSVEDAARLARDLYAVRGTVLELPADRDRNFRIETENGAAYVLKIANAAEDKAVLDLQCRALAHLRRHVGEALLPRVIASQAGEEICTVKAGQGTPHFARLVTYLPGTPLARFTPHFPALLETIGETLGEIDAALQDFSHPAADRVLPWDMRHAATVIRQHLHCLEQPEQRALVAYFLEHFEREVHPHLQTLRTSVIHNDANDYNIIVQLDDESFCRLAGLIDFGDMLRTVTVSEPAIAAAYVLLNKPDPLEAARRVVAGYHRAFPLRARELALLFPLICIRLCTSVTLAAFQAQQEPDNAYLRVSEAPAWAALQRLREINPDFAHYLFRDACGLPACPVSARVISWLAAHAGALHPVTEPDLRTAPVQVFDFGVASPVFTHPPRAEEMPAFSQRIFDRLAENHATAGIGRYGETRLLYPSESFQHTGNDGPESRTVHLGLDLFLPAGAPVFAPLGGTVQSVQAQPDPLDYGHVLLLRHAVENGALVFYTLYGHLSRDVLARVKPGQRVRRGQQIATLGDIPENGGWPPHLHFQLIVDALQLGGDFPGVARPSQKRLWLNLCPDPNLLLQVPAEQFPAPALQPEDIRAARQRRLSRALSLAYRKPLHIVRGAGQHLYDADGQAYLDAVNNVPHVGHCHPRVVAAGQRQMAVLNTNTRYLHENIIRYAERLCATLPDPLSVCFFVCSGSEANELALRLARAHTGRQDVIVLDAAYHGNTGALVDLSPYKYKGPGGGGKPAHVHEVMLPDPYRGPYKRDDPEAGRKYAAHVRAALVQAARGGREIGAFICESLPGCAGQIVLPEGYLQAAYAYVHASGGICIADEVQVGFGRVGTHFWGFELQGVVPDIVTLGKPIGNGDPLGAVVTTPQIARSFENGMEYFNTFGGNPVACAIGLAVLDVIADERLQERALQVGTVLRDDLQALQDKHALIGDVRGSGLFIGVELVRDREMLKPAAAEAAYVVERLRDRGILISTDGPLHNVLKIKPPLVFNEANAGQLVTGLDEILHESFIKK